MLRRLKSDVALHLPPKKEVLVYAPLTQKQETFYKAALDGTILDLVGDKVCVCVTVHYTAQIFIPLSSYCIILFYFEIVIINIWLLRPGMGLRLGCGSTVFKACFQRSKFKRKKVQNLLYFTLNYCKIQ